LNQIYTWGADIPDPFINFKDLDLPKQLLTNIKDAGFCEPTPIQMEAIPIMLNNQNLLANAPTGNLISHSINIS
jgi:superfamily II DNA/RNA helicase